MALSGSVTTAAYSDRSLTLTWSAKQSISDNKSTISWELKGSGSKTGWVRVSEIQVVIDGKQAFYQGSDTHLNVYNGTWITSGTRVIEHKSDGTKSFNITVKAGIYEWSINKQGSKDFTLDTIPRASSISCSTFTMDTSGTISVTRASTSFSHTITYAFGEKKGTVCTKSTNTSVSWKPPLDLAHAIPNNTSGKGTLYCDTYNGDTKIGSKSISFDCNVPSSVKPSCSISIANTNNTFGCYARLLSGVKVTPSASGSYSSTISEIKIDVTDKTSKTATSGKEYTFDSFSSTGKKTITVTAKDSRGRTSTASSTIDVVNYDYPTSNISASRGTGSTISSFVASDTGEYAKITSTGSVSNITGNTLTPSLEYRVNGTSTWQKLSISTSSITLSNTQIISASDVYAYDIKLTVKDKAGKVAVSSMTLSNAYATVDFKAGGDGIAFGETARRSGFDCAMLMRILKGVQLMDETSANGFGWADWCYNNAGTQQINGSIYASSDGIHVSARQGKGFLDGTWSGSLSDERMKRDIEPIAQNIISAVGEVPFMQFRMSAPDYDHDELCVGILAQDLQRAFSKYGVSDKLLMLDTRKLNHDDENEYYCIEYTHFLIVRLLYNELKLQAYDERLKTIERKLGM